MTIKGGVQTLNDDKQEQRLEDPFDIFGVPPVMRTITLNLAIMLLKQDLLFLSLKLAVEKN